MLRAVLFDFSDTLFPAYGETQIKELLLAEDPDLDMAQFMTIAGAVARHGSSPEELARGRDLSADAHRECWTHILRPFDHFGPGTAERIYANITIASGRAPFPDTAEVLEELHRRRVPMGIVSDIGWDLRPFFEHHGLGRYIRSWVLSFEHGIEKPDPRLFHRGCMELGAESHETVMIGDSPERDGGAVNAGLTSVVLPKYGGTGDRGLRTVLGLLG